MAVYKVRWKAKVLGEFTRAEIQLNLRSSKFTLFHQVFAGDAWLKIKDFLDNYQEDLEAPKSSIKQIYLNLAYFSAGLAFLSPYLLLISLGFSGYLFKKNLRISALVLSLLSLLMMFSGLGFFYFVNTLKA